MYLLLADRTFLAVQRVHDLHADNAKFIPTTTGENPRHVDFSTGDQFER